MASQVVTYAVGDSQVSFEIEPAAGFRPAGGAGDLLGQVQRAVGPAVEAAKAILDKAKEAQPDRIELKFGVKVSGGANWLVAKAVGEGNFEISMSWDRDSGDDRPAGQAAASPAGAGATG